LLEAVSDYARSQDVFSASLCYIDTDDLGQPWSLEIVAEWHTAGITAPVGTRFDLRDFAFAKLWMSSPNATLLVGDVTSDERVDPVTRATYQQFGIAASALLPLNLKGRWAGLVIYNWDKPHTFDDNDQRIYDALMQQTAPVINGVRASEQTQQAKEQA